MIREYLKDHGAIGRKKALTTTAIITALHLNKRQLVEIVAKERAAGALICSTTSGRGGYYLPASFQEIKEQKDILEQGIRVRAMALRPFRRYIQKHNLNNPDNVIRAIERERASHEE